MFALIGILFFTFSVASTLVFALALLVRLDEVTLAEDNALGCGFHAFVTAFCYLLIVAGIYGVVDLLRKFAMWL